MPNQAVDILRQGRENPQDTEMLLRYIQQMQGQQGQPEQQPQPMPQLQPPIQQQQPQQEQPLPPLSRDQQMNQAAIRALMNYDYPRAGQLWQQTLMINPQNQDAIRGLQRIQEITSHHTRLGREIPGGYR